MYKIHCEVYGGVTGHRTSFMKNNGKEIVFERREDAERALPDSYTNINGVCFNYCIVEVY
jgi:hypothetical protein